MSDTTCTSNNQPLTGSGAAPAGRPTQTEERGAALALLPLAATLLYYASPHDLRQQTPYQFLPQVCAYAALLIWSRINSEPATRLGLARALIPQGLRWGMATGLILATVNLLVILYVVPVLGEDYRFLAETPHAKVPLFLMVPWFILFIATMVELNFRGFLLGRLQVLGVPAPLAVVISAVLFAFDPFMVATFRHLHWIAIWDGLVWGTLQCRQRNLFTPIIAHAVEVIVLYVVMRAVLG